MLYRRLLAPHRAGPASVDIVRAMTALRRAGCDDVALTENIRVEDQSRYWPSTFLLHLSPDVGPEEAAFIKQVGARSEQRQWLRFLYAHSREGRNVFMTSDVETFGTEGSERRQHLTNAARTQIMTLAEFERGYATARARSTPLAPRVLLRSRRAGELIPITPSAGALFSFAGAQPITGGGGGMHCCPS